MIGTTRRIDFGQKALAVLASVVLLLPIGALAQQPPSPGANPGNNPTAAPTTAADQIADAFSRLGDQIYEECIFELSEEQVEVQDALIRAYMKEGASGAAARRIAAAQIVPPKPSEKCEQVRRSPAAATSGWGTTVSVPKKPTVEIAVKPPSTPVTPAVTLKDRKMLPQWDCAENVDYVTIHLNGYARKLTGGEICNPYEDVVHEVPPSLQSFRLGYTIRTGRLFVISNDPATNGRTIAWAISGRDVCRNNPDPDCFAARAIGPLPPGEYVFPTDKSQRISWGPRTKRNVAAIYLKKLWHKERFTPQQIAAIRKRGNIAIHVRLKGEMSEACLGLEPKGWAYVASLIKDGRATSLDVHIDEPYVQMAEKPPVVAGSSFSLTSLFK
ncbi:MAG: DUF2778 domain-containing protein [Hyphomicrobium sp.]